MILNLFPCVIIARAPESLRIWLSFFDFMVGFSMTKIAPAFRTPKREITHSGELSRKIRVSDIELLVTGSVLHVSLFPLTYNLSPITHRLYDFSLYILHFLFAPFALTHHALAPSCFWHRWRHLTEMPGSLFFALKVPKNTVDLFLLKTQGVGYIINRYIFFISVEQEIQHLIIQAEIEFLVSYWKAISIRTGRTFDDLFSHPQVPCQLINLGLI